MISDDGQSALDTNLDTLQYIVRAARSLAYVLALLVLRSLLPIAHPLAATRSMSNATAVEAASLPLASHSDLSRTPLTKSRSSCSVVQQHQIHGLRMQFLFSTPPS
jgi:hypothetical protein